MTKKTPAQLDREIAQNLARQPTRPGVMFGAVRVANLPAPFAKRWSNAVRTIRRHIKALTEGDRDAFQAALNARQRLYKLLNTGELDRATADQLLDFVEGRGPDPLPRLSEAEETGRQARSATLSAEIGRLRAAERPGLDPHTLEGELYLTTRRR